MFGMNDARPRWIATAAREVAGLFVEDARFAGLIFAWLVVAGLLLPRLGLPPVLPPLLLFVGLACILVEGALHRAALVRRR
jgi:hypothetical protein